MREIPAYAFTMTELVRVLLVDGPSGDLAHVKETLDRFPGIFQVIHTTRNELARMALGSHWHIAVVNMAADLRACHNKDFLNFDDQTPAHYVGALETMGVKVICCEPSISEQNSNNDIADTQVPFRRKLSPRHREIPVKEVLTTIFATMRFIHEKIFQPPPTKWLEPYRPKPPFEAPERFLSPLAIEMMMSQAARECYNGFLAGREARRIRSS